MPSWQSHVIELVVRSRVKRRILSTEDVRAIRARLGPPPLLRHALSVGLRVEPVMVGTVRAEWVGEAATPDAPVLLFLHGGGYLAGSADTHRPLAAALARRLGARALVPDYRLAPECPFPGAVEDSLAAYRYLLELGIPAERIVIAGDSAGGGLTVAGTLAARDAGLPMPRALACFSPWVDLAHAGASLDENEERCSMLRRAAVEKAATAYLAGASPHHPLASPVYAELDGLPPLLVHSSADELLRDDGVRLAARARAARVPVEFALYARVPHAWQHFERVLPEARASLDAAARFLARVTPRGPADVPSHAGSASSTLA
ncbi:MAG: alpha/beta hydrolase [Gemmatimonadaceae bacterium]|jgi:acetyl esterase/lipase|nr:alpha/beta hydrolase [Gemmatimonadaceae bacterium]